MSLFCKPRLYLPHCKCEWRAKRRLLMDGREFQAYQAFSSLGRCPGSRLYESGAFTIGWRLLPLGPPHCAGDYSVVGRVLRHCTIKRSQNEATGRGPISFLRC